MPDNQTTTTTDNKIPEKQNKVEIPEDNVPRLTVKLRQPQLQFGNKTTTKTTPTDNKRKLKNDNKPTKEKPINTKVTKIKKQPSIEGYITTNRSKNNGQENTGTTTITTNNTKETTGHPQPTTNQGNKQHNQTVKAKSDITRKPTPKQRLKPPDIDKLTPVSLKIKVRGTVVSDMKEFLARKKLERDNKCKVLPTARADTNISGEKNISPTIFQTKYGRQGNAAIRGISVENCDKKVQ